MLTQAHEWHIPKGAEFGQMQATTHDPSKYPCHNCGGIVNRVKDCDEPKNEKRIAKNVKKFNDEKVKRQQDARSS